MTTTITTGFAKINSRLDSLDASVDSLETRSRGASTPDTGYSESVPQTASLATEILPGSPVSRAAHTVEGETAVADPDPSSPVVDEDATHALPSANTRSILSELEVVAKLTSEYMYYDANPYTPFSSTHPSESFVKALFPPLQLRDNASQRPTPDDLIPGEMELPEFDDWEDPQLHRKLRDLQNAFRKNGINFDDWPFYATVACSPRHETIQNWAYGPDCRWHHFVLAIICADGLEHYYMSRDAAFTLFPKTRKIPAEKVLYAICRELDFAPCIFKTTYLRSMEFQSHLYRLDLSTLDRIERFVPDGSHRKLLSWAYDATSKAVRYWKGYRASYNAVRQGTTLPL
ncbi:hypothetical protein SEPCBS119000_000956 [Sporothrix epigloea]|uniref:Uncharacterized protein n=1 Tax=Sporothrix epigloea TaxID=1892477 RepID=A0ABP0D813_9PEZI